MYNTDLPHGDYSTKGESKNEQFTLRLLIDVYSLSDVAFTIVL